MSLEKSISLPQAIIYGIGIILGAGIYALIGEAAGIAGNAVWLSFVFAAIIASFTAFSYAELSTIFSKSAAEYVYVERSTNSKKLAFFVGYLTILATIISAAAVSLGFATYAKLFIPLPQIIIAIILIVVLSIINFKGISESVKMNTIFTLIEAGGLFIIIIIGAPFLGKVDLLASSTGAPFLSPLFLAPIFSATALIFFAYLGFEDLANIAEETKNPKKNIPIATIVSLVVTTIIYILVAMVAVSVVSPAALLEASSASSLTEGPLALVATTALQNPTAGFVFTIIALFATSNTVLILLIVASRILYGMSSENSLPKFLSKIHYKNKTPYYAVFVAGVISIIFTLNGSIGDVAALTNLSVFLFFFAVNASLIILRYKNRANKSSTGFRSPINISWFPVLPFIGSLFCLLMFFTQYWNTINILGFEIPILILGVLVFAVAFPLYYFFEKTKVPLNKN